MLKNLILEINKNQILEINKDPNIRRQPAPYPYIANAQEPNIRQTPTPYPYPANAQTPTIKVRKNLISIIQDNLILTIIDRHLLIRRKVIRKNLILEIDKHRLHTMQQ